jgi:hypothetical protein
MPIRIRDSILMPIQIRIRYRILPQVILKLEDQNLFYFYSQQCQLTLFPLSHSFIGVIYSVAYFVQHIKNFLKRVKIF